ncbi:MAG: OmpA family protein [Candidatus Obscuribacter sp.]|nr:OmpA family protein [Candidatus Obscuribacter sp.]
MKRRHNTTDGIGHSMVDLMTSLAVIFILLLVAYLNRAVYETSTAKRVIKGLLAGTKTKRDGLQQKLDRVSIIAETDPDDPLTLVSSLGSEKLQFDHDKVELKPEGKAYLKQFAPKLAAVLSSPDCVDDVESVLIEGHTDSDGNDEHNLQLSQGRSYAVLLFLINECGLPSEQRFRLLRLISASGRGESDLIRDANGVENKTLSRRVAVKIRVKSIEQKKSPELEHFIGSASVK